MFLLVRWGMEPARAHKQGRDEAREGLKQAGRNKKARHKAPKAGGARTRRSGVDPVG